MRSIYIAGKFGARERLRHERTRLHRLGLGRVVSTWLDLEDDALTPAQNQTEGHRDLKEVLASDLLIIDTHEPTRRGARETEFGIALGAGIEAWQVGPPISVFHYTVPHFSDWDEVLDALVKENR